PHLALRHAQALKGLRARHLMDEMAVDIKEAGAVVLTVHQMAVPDLVEKRAWLCHRNPFLASPLTRPLRGHPLPHCGRGRDPPPQRREGEGGARTKTAAPMSPARSAPRRPTALPCRRGRARRCAPSCR